MSKGINPVSSDFEYQKALSWYALSRDERVQVEEAVSIWKMADDCGTEFCRICARIWEAIKSIFGQSAWQHARNMLMNHLQGPEAETIAENFLLSRIHWVDFQGFGKDIDALVLSFLSPKELAASQLDRPNEIFIYDQRSVDLARLRATKNLTLQDLEYYRAAFALGSLAEVFTSLPISRLESLELGISDEDRRSMYKANVQNCPPPRINRRRLEQINDVVLQAVAQNCPQLKRLDTIGCRQITFAGLQAVAQNCPQLTSLRVNGSPITFEELHTLRELLPQLTFEGSSGGNA